MKNTHGMKLTKEQLILYKTWLYTFLAIIGIHLVWSFLFLNQKISESFGRLEVQISGLGMTVAIVTYVLFIINKEKNFMKGTLLGALFVGLGFLITAGIANYNSPNLTDGYLMGRLIGYALLQGVISGALITHFHRKLSHSH